LLALVFDPGQARQHPQVVGQHRPCDLRLAVLETFRTRATAEENILKNTDATFGLRTSALPRREGFVVLGALAELRGITRTETLEVIQFGEVFAVGFAVKTAIGNHSAQCAAAFLLHDRIALAQPLCLARLVVLTQFMIEDKPLGDFRKKQAVAEFNVSTRFASLNQTNVFFIKAENFVRVGHGSPADEFPHFKTGKILSLSAIILHIGWTPHWVRRRSNELPSTP